MRAALILVALALGAATAFAQPSGEAEDEAAETTGGAETAGAPPSPETLALNPLAALDKTALSGFRDMPLFTPSRRRPEPPPEVVEAPPPPPPPPPASKPAPPPGLKLAGVVQGPEGAVAVVENEDTGGKIERLRLGDQVGGWLVTAIDPSALRLTLDEREEQYRMFERSEASSETAEAPDTEESGAPLRRPKPRAQNRATQPDDEDEDQ